MKKSMELTFIGLETIKGWRGSFSFFGNFISMHENKDDIDVHNLNINI